ncbi:MAG: phosphodiester glycosidase family protein [Clostridiales bacterium]|nr:phosphodiester glycosidase family protein [Clostridiales bacterium]
MNRLMTIWFAVMMLLALPFSCTAEEIAYTPVKQVDAPGISVTVESMTLEGTECFLCRITMDDPGTQIRKVSAPWKESLLLPSDMASEVPDGVLAINGSGYVSPVFPWIPENYPGDNPDYYYTPLGSLTITDGEIFRNLDGVPYFGLTLQQDGLHIHAGEDNQQVLAASPSQTWSFYVECPFLLDGQSVLDPDWKFTNTPAMRTIIAKTGDKSYAVLTVTSKGGGLTMAQCTDYLLTHIKPQWAYNLDGGPSSALMIKGEDGQWQTLWGNRSKDMDVMVFAHLEDTYLVTDDEE